MHSTKLQITHENANEAMIHVRMFYSVNNMKRSCWFLNENLECGKNIRRSWMHRNVHCVLNKTSKVPQGIDCSYWPQRSVDDIIHNIGNECRDEENEIDDRDFASISIIAIAAFSLVPTSEESLTSFRRRRNLNAIAALSTITRSSERITWIANMLSWKAHVKYGKSGRSVCQPQNVPVTLHVVSVMTPNTNADTGTSESHPGTMHKASNATVKRRPSSALDRRGKKTTTQRSIIMATTA